ncbi:MAG: alpha/beta hydrolase, partial [Croceibacterium sp.]
RRIALSSTGVHWVRPGEAESRRALSQVGHTRGFAALVDEWLPPMVAPANRDKADLYNGMRQMCLDNGQAMFDAQITAQINRPVQDVLLEQIACPALVMTGELDAWAPPAQHAAIADRIANSELVIVPGAGHMLPAEAPDAVNAAIARWLAMPA